MTTDITNLRLFCEYVIHKHDDLADMSTETLADEFRRMFLDGLPINPKSLEAVAMSLGVRITARPTPKGIRGYNDIYDGTMSIYYKNDDCRSGKENTILHEIRELMEAHFADLQPSYAPLRTSAVHNEANRFAGAVLLPREEFKRMALKTGLDARALGDHYSKSYAQIIIRIAEVMQGDMFYYGALYEPCSGHESSPTVTCWSASSPDDSVCVPATLFPRRGHVSAVGSIADYACKDKKPYLVNEVIISEENSDNNLIAIAQPIISDSWLAKILLVAVLLQDRDTIEPQIEQLNPITIEKFEGHL
jgi:hypothetical protein